MRAGGRAPACATRVGFKAPVALKMLPIRHSPLTMPPVSRITPLTFQQHFSLTHGAFGGLGSSGSGWQPPLWS